MTLKRYQVFVSSTYRDLIEERAAVTNCLLDNDCIPVGMEQFPAMPISQWEYIKKMIDSSDYYLLILAGKYGSVDSQSGLSYTEKEFRYAVERNIPIIAFLYRDIKKLSYEKCEETDEGRKNVERFRKEVLNSNHLCDFYASIDGLKYAVAKSLRRTIEECPANGWVRSDQIDNFQSKTIEQLQEILLMMKNTMMEEKNNHFNVDITAEAKTLLMEACASKGNGEIVVSRTLSGTTVSTGDKVFCDEATARLKAIWLEAIEELVKKKFIVDDSGKHEVYHVTCHGYDYVDRSESKIVSKLRKEGYDNVDVCIINTMINNDKASIPEISQIIGYTTVSTMKRINNLKNKGIVLWKVSSGIGKWVISEEGV